MRCNFLHPGDGSRCELLAVSGPWCEVHSQPSLRRPAAQLTFAEQLDAEEAAAGLDYPPRPRPLAVEALLPFRHGGEFAGRYSNEWLVAETQKPFQPKGLMLWHADGLEVSAAYIGTNLELVCGFGSVPAAWFATQQSFEAVVAAQKAGKAAAAWGHWSPVHPGVLVRLQFSGPAAHVRALLWGLTT